MRSELRSVIKVKKSIHFIGLLIICLGLIAGCSVKPIGTLTDEGSVFDQDIGEGNKEDGELSVKEEQIIEVIEYEKINYSGDSAILQTTESKNIEGYLTGSYYGEWVEAGLTTVVFMETAGDAHLDLLEIRHGDQQWVSDIVLTSDFHVIEYDLTSLNEKVKYRHDLATNIATIVEASTIVSKGGKVVTSTDTGSMSGEATDNDGAYDTVIANGIVVDTQHRAYMFGYDVGIRDGKIVAISDATLVGTEVIDATGLIVSPGFIDMLTFNLSDIGAKYKILDGVTSGLSNHGCTEDFDGFFAQYDRYGSYVNYGGAIYAIRIRWEAGLGNYGIPNEDQIQFMADRVREEIEAGGIALAFSPEYYPGTTPEEIKAMMAVAAEYDIPTHFHSRYSSLVGDNTGLDGVKEVIDYAKELDARVQFMHLHSTGGTGMMDEALAMINAAREEGYDVNYDIYPYDSWASRIEWERYKPGWQERYDITYSDLQMAGTSERLTEKSFNELRNGDGGLCIAYAMDEGEMLKALSTDYAMVGSDGCIEHESGGNDHFRGAGTFSRILGKYVRDENVFSLMDGLRKMTYNSAAHFESTSNDMALRGRMGIGCIADITVFDYRTIIDQSTAEFPATPSKGIEYVLVNGQVGVRQGELIKSVRGGQSIANNYRVD